MSYADSQFQPAVWGNNIAAQAQPNERVDFIRKTYLHLLAAVLAFCGLEVLYLNTQIAADLMQRMVNGGNSGLFITFILFVGCSWLARYWATSSTSVGLQYAGLALYVFAQSVIFIPILFYAQHYAGKDVIPTGRVDYPLTVRGLDSFGLYHR